MSDIYQVTVPEFGSADSFVVVNLPVSTDELIETGRVVAVLENDEVVLEIPTFESGRIRSIDVSIGDAVGPGDALVRLEVESSAKSDVGERTLSNRSAGRSEPMSASPKHNPSMRPDVTAFAQRLTLALVVVTAIGAFLFPPFSTSIPDAFIGYYPIFTPPEVFSAYLNVGLLAIQEAVIFAVGAVIYLLFTPSMGQSYAANGGHDGGGLLSVGWSIIKAAWSLLLKWWWVILLVIAILNIVKVGSIVSHY